MRRTFVGDNSTADVKSGRSNADVVEEMMQKPLFTSVAMLVPLLLGIGAAPGFNPSDETSPTESTRPEPSTDPVAWAEVVSRLGNSLVDSKVRAAEVPLFLPEATVQPIAGGTSAGPEELSGRFDGQLVISARGYIAANMTPARELGQDVAALAARLANTPMALPESLVRALTPPTDMPVAADLAASQWLLSELDAGMTSRVGLIVLWKPNRDRATGAFGSGLFDLYGRLSFVLLRGELDPIGRWRVAYVRFGTAEQALSR